jgi:hypothetical protein
MKYFILLLSVIALGSCSNTEESTTNPGTNVGSAISPVELTVGTAKSGSVAKYGNSFYKFTTSSSGAGSYKLTFASMSVSESYSSSNSIKAYFYSSSGYSRAIETETCLTVCEMVLNYRNLDNSTTYYLKIYGYGAVSYKLTVSQAGSEGSESAPVALTLGTAHSAKVEGTWVSGKSYYTFSTVAADNYTLTMTNANSLDATLYSDSSFSSGVYYCTASSSLSCSMDNSSGGLSASKTYYLKVMLTSSTAQTNTFNLTLAAEGN